MSKLLTLTIVGFKCFKESVQIPFHGLTVFIGENDSGKTTILEALSCLVNNDSIKNEMFYKPPIGVSSLEGKITIEAKISIDVANDSKEEYKSHEKRIRREITKESSHYYVYSISFADKRLNEYKTYRVSQLNELLISLNLPAPKLKTQKQKVIEQFIDEHRSELEIKNEWIREEYSNLRDDLSAFYLYNSSDYGNPEQFIKKSIDPIYQDMIFETKEDKELIPSLQKLRKAVNKKLNSHIKKSLLSIIQKYKPEVTQVKGRCDVNFKNCLEYQGLHLFDQYNNEMSLNEIGEGSRKRIHLALLEWDTTVKSELMKRCSMIKAYDEPDANLHYDAQRKLFNTITKPLELDNRLQVIVCTHSLTLIDRVAAKNINKLTKRNESIEVAYLKSDDDEDVRQFLTQVSEMSGLKNSLIFFEKCFLIVEGESEEMSIPVLYKTYFSRSLMEDGVVVFNLKSNGAWRNVVKLLYKNKQQCTVMLLDNEVQTESSNKVTKDSLGEIGIDETFITSNCFFIGHKEFEDTYQTEILIRLLNSKFPKEDSLLWLSEEIEEMKMSAKFSNELKRRICTLHKKHVSKPQIALEVAKKMSKEDIDQNSVLALLFQKIEDIIRC